jgi:hypothetical protein
MCSLNDPLSQAAQLDQLTIRQRLAHELNERKHRIPAVLDALNEKAKRGDVPAARELRGWLTRDSASPGTPASTRETL